MSPRAEPEIILWNTLKENNIPKDIIKIPPPQRKLEITQGVVEKFQFHFIFPVKLREIYWAFSAT